MCSSAFSIISGSVVTLAASITEMPMKATARRSSQKSRVARMMTMNVTTAMTWFVVTGSAALPIRVVSQPTRPAVEAMKKILRAVEAKALRAGVGIMAAEIPASLGGPC